MERTVMAGVLAMLAAMTVALAVAQPVAAKELGVFRNPSGSVRVKLADCGQGLCGTIVSANAKARADAAKAGQTRLIGLQLFREMTPAEAKDGGRRWEGKVYVPDLDKEVSGEAMLKGRTMTVKGCLVAGALCKGQDWVQVK